MSNLTTSGNKSFQGMVLQAHLFNNPVMRVAAWTLAESATARSAADAEDKTVSKSSDSGDGNGDL